MKLVYIIKCNFAKIVSIPPRLKIKNPKPTDKNMLNPLYNLLKSEKLSENKNETFNSIEKSSYDELIISSSKNLSDNYYNIYDQEQEKHIESLYLFLNESLSTKEINLFITYLNEAKNIIDSNEIEKNDKIFTMFLDKLLVMTERKFINEHLIKSISNISLKYLNSNSIFKYSNPESRKLATVDNSIYFSELDSSFKNNMMISNPILNDFEDPQKEYKDAFELKNQYFFNFPLFVQKKNSLTKFDCSNYVIFDKMPFIFPLKNKETSEVEIKQLNNEIIFKNNINLNHDEIYKKFVIKYIQRSFSSSFTNIKVDSLEFYNLKDNDRSLTSSPFNENLMYLKLYPVLKL